MSCALPGAVALSERDGELHSPNPLCAPRSQTPASRLSGSTEPEYPSPKGGATHGFLSYPRQYHQAQRGPFRCCRSRLPQLGTKLTNEWDGLTHDYTRKGGVVHAEIMLPAHAPPEFSDRSTLWNSVEQIEKARDSQLAREIEAALPRELSREQQLALVRAYVKDNFVDKGMCADFAIHDKGTGNPHVHIMLTVRPLKENGRMGRKVPQGIRPGRERPAHPERERRLEKPPGGYHRLERQRECGDLAGGMGGLYQPGIGGRRSACPGRPPQLQAPGH